MSELHPDVCSGNTKQLPERHRRRVALVLAGLILSVTVSSCSFDHSLPTLEHSFAVEGESPLLQMVADNFDAENGIPTGNSSTIREIGSSQDLFFAMQESLDVFSDDLYIEIESLELFWTYWDELVREAAIHSVYLKGPIDLEYRDTSPCVIRMMFSYDDAGLILQKHINGEPMEFDRESTALLWQKAMSVKDEIIRDEMTDIEKEIAIHDYLVSGTTYATEGDQTVLSLAQSVLINKEGQCQGYAEAMGLLLTLSGIRTRVISGYASNSSEVSEPHAWNQVFIEGNWYHVDATWNDPVPDMKEYVSHTYLNRSDMFMRLDHTWTSFYSSCPYDYEEMSVNP